MQNTINLASDTTSDAPTRKRSKGSDNDFEDDIHKSLPHTEQKSDYAVSKSIWELIFDKAALKTQKRSKSSKLKDPSIVRDKTISKASKDQSKTSQIEADKSAKDESIFDNSAERPIDVSIKDKASDIANNSPDASKIDKPDINQDTNKPEKEKIGMQENPTEEHLRNVDPNNQIKSNDTTIHEMLKNKNNSQSFDDVKDNSGGKLLYSD